MLQLLTIRDVILVERLDIAFHPRLCVLTGETGAGKSILLDALGLALGGRADSGLVRKGAAKAGVSASFEVAAGDGVLDLLAGQGVAVEDDTVILRRVLGADGRSRAYINDQPVSVGLLRQVGESLVEIHGQFENMRLMDPSSHRTLLDAFGDLGGPRSRVSGAHETWLRARRAREAAAQALEAARRNEAGLRHGVDELRTLDTKPGEERDLAESRGLLMQREQLVAAMNEADEALRAGRGVEATLRAAAGVLSRVAPLAEGGLDESVAALDRAAVEAAEAAAHLDRAATALELDPERLERIEERLFALRGIARKHGVSPDALPDLAKSLAAQLAAVEDGGQAVARLETAEADARDAFAVVSRDLGAKRRTAGQRLAKAVLAELEPLRLGDARFVVSVSPLPEAQWGEDGADAVVFQVATNPGQDLGPLNRISSGGELARFMLALKVVLARADPVPTIVFDEVDSGVGGAVAAAVGDRLARLAEDFQVLVVTHSPQVAARGVHHWRVSKGAEAIGTVTTVDALDDGDRREEIARMLAGARITDEARAAAASLLDG